MTESTTVPFEPGQPVVLGAGPAHARRWYRTMVTQVDARVVWVDGAPDDQPLVEIQPGEDVTCHTWRHMDALYEAEARVAFARLAPEPLMGLTILRAERIQQREYVRVPLSTEASALYTGTDANTLLLQPRPVELEIFDLSASGLRGRSSLPLEPGDELTIDLSLPRTGKGTNVPVHLRGRVVALPDLPEPLNLRARVVRLVDPSHSDELAHEIGVTFVDVPREARERIIRFALDVQRDRRRRGMM